MTSAFSFHRDGSVPTRRFPSLARRVAEIPAVRWFDESCSTWSNAFTRTCAEIEISLGQAGLVLPLLPLFSVCKVKGFRGDPGLTPLRRWLRKWLWCRWHVLLFLEVVGYRRISIATSPFRSISIRFSKSSLRPYSPMKLHRTICKIFSNAIFFCESPCDQVREVIGKRSVISRLIRTDNFISNRSCHRPKRRYVFGAN